MNKPKNKLIAMRFCRKPKIVGSECVWPNLHIKTDPLKGLGLFAGKVIKAETLIPYGGVEIHVGRDLTVHITRMQII